MSKEYEVKWREVWYPASQSGKVSIYAVKGVHREGKGMPVYTLGEKRRRVVCGECDGAESWDKTIGAEVCSECKGTGKVWEYAE